MERDEPVCKIAFIETANITYPDKVISIILYKAQTHFGSQESDSKRFWIRLLVTKSVCF